MRNLLMSAAALALLTGCTSTDSAFSGSPHGYSGRLNTFWADVNAVPTILQNSETALHSSYGADGSQSDMPSTFEADAAGNIKATGVAAYWMAMAAYCRSGGNCGPSDPNLFP